MSNSALPFRPQDWLLLLFDGAAESIDRIRIQKAMFLFAQRSKAADYEKYSFEPYDYGPFSAAIYTDLDRFEASDLVRRSSGVGSPAYSLTALGRAASERLKERALPERVAILHRIREWVLERNFNKLLTDVYEMYPEYATRSVFQKR